MGGILKSPNISLLSPTIQNLRLLNQLNDKNNSESNFIEIFLLYKIILNNFELTLKLKNNKLSFKTNIKFKEDLKYFNIFLRCLIKYFILQNYSQTNLIIDKINNLSQIKSLSDNYVYNSVKKLPIELNQKTIK